MSPEELVRIKNLLPVAMGSDELREQVAADILRRSIFSARMEDLRYLALVRDTCAEISAGAINQAEARARLLNDLARMGHSPRDGGGITNPASLKRLDLIIDTQRQMAASVANMAAETPETLYDWPAVELSRYDDRAVPRTDWGERWQAAGDSVGWQGAVREAGFFPEWRMVALKSSPIWEALGNGVGGYKDTLRNPYPPFAFGTGLGWEDVSREEAIALGLNPDAASPKSSDPTLSPSEKAMAEAAERLGFADAFSDLARGMK